jgi:hypothetical protein
VEYFLSPASSSSRCRNWLCKARCGTIVYLSDLRNLSPLCISPHRSCQSK